MIGESAKIEKNQMRHFGWFPNNVESNEEEKSANEA